MAIEIVDFPIKKIMNFHSYVKLPEGIQYESHLGSKLDETWARFTENWPPHP
jgi:hypothetical protein